MEQQLTELQLRQHMLREDFEVFHFTGNNGVQIALHFHDFFECSLLLSGKLSYQIESASFAEQPGDLLLISPNQLHRPLFIHGTEPYERIVFWLSRSFVERLSDEKNDLSACFSGGRSGAIRLGGAVRAQITRLFSELISANSGEAFGRELLCRSLAACLLVHLNRIARGTVDTAALDEIHVSPLVQQVSSYLDAHIDEAITLDAVAQAAFLSKYYLERKFKEETGASIYQMLLQKRMIRARNLMREGLPMMQVAMRCGFADYSGFYKAFHNAYGISPREYLAQM